MFIVLENLACFLVAHGISCSNCGKKQTQKGIIASQEYCALEPRSQDASWEFWGNLLLTWLGFVGPYMGMEEKGQK